MPKLNISTHNLTLATVESKVTACQQGWLDWGIGAGPEDFRSTHPRQRTPSWRSQSLCTGYVAVRFTHSLLAIGKVAVTLALEGDAWQLSLCVCVWEREGAVISDNRMWSGNEEEKAEFY